jgi:hypothetical protein
MEMFEGFSNMIDVFIRISLVLMMSGIFIGLLFREWIPILHLGIILALPAIIIKGIDGIMSNWSNEIVGIDNY